MWHAHPQTKAAFEKERSERSRLQTSFDSATKEISFLAEQAKYLAAAREQVRPPIDVSIEPSPPIDMSPMRHGPPQKKTLLPEDGLPEDPPPTRPPPRRRPSHKTASQKMCTRLPAQQNQHSPATSPNEPVTFLILCG